MEDLFGIRRRHCESELRIGGGYAVHEPYGDGTREFCRADKEGFVIFAKVGETATGDAQREKRLHVFGLSGDAPGVIGGQHSIRERSNSVAAGGISVLDGVVEVVVRKNRREDALPIFN